MKKLIIIMFCIILLVSTISAWDFDNIKSYDAETKTITIINALGLGDDIAEIKLDTPLVYEVPRGYQKVAEFTINNFENYSDVFNNLEFFDVRKDNEKFERDYDYKYKTIIEVPAYKTVCDEGLSENGTIEYINCRQEQTGFKDEIVWEELNINNELPKGKTTIGIFTEVLKGDKVEWIPTLFNFEIDEWAIWTANLNVGLVSYYKFDEQDITGTGTIYDELGVNNGTNNGADNTTGKINTAYTFVRANTDDINVPQDIFTGEGAMTISAWFNTSNPQLTGTLFRDGIEVVLRFYSVPSTFYFAVSAGGSGEVSATISDEEFSANTWYHVVGVYNGTNVLLYINGTQTGTIGSVTGNIDVSTDAAYFGSRAGVAHFWDGTLDEIGFWNRALSPSEVSDLWNNGDGVSYGDIGINITLNSPVDNYNSISPTITFNGGVSDIIGNEIVNVSLYIDGVINETNSSGINNTDYIFTKTLSDGDHNWTYETCDDMDECATATTRSLTIHKINITSQTYNNETIEGATETFIANVTLRGGETLLSVNLNYNGTSKPASAESLVNGSMWNLISTFTIPGVPADVNISFFWMVTLVAGQVNSSSYIQTVRNIGIDNCTTHSNVIFNYTMVDEEDQTQLVGNTDNTTLDLAINIFNLDKSVSVLNFSTTYNQTNPAAVCLSINLTDETIYTLDSIIKYQADDYVIEYYNIQNFELRNSSIPQEITLYDLLTADSTEFQITFKDSNFVAVENALIQINRQYVSEGLFKTVEIPKTDSNGQTVAHLVEKAIVYNIIVLKEGVILGTFNNVIAFCEDALVGSCFITLNALEAGERVFDYDEEIGLLFSFDYNETTRILQFDFSTTDGSVKNISLASIKMDQLGNTSVCDSYLVSSSGSLYCTVPASIGNETIIVKIYVDGDLKIRNYISAGTEFDIGDAGYFLMFFLVLSLALMMTQSKIGVILGVVLGFIASSLLSLFKGGIMGIGSSLIWLIIMGVILIWKLNSDRQT